MTSNIVLLLLVIQLSVPFLAHQKLKEFLRGGKPGISRFPVNILDIEIANYGMSLSNRRQFGQQ